MKKSLKDIVVAFMQNPNDKNHSDNATPVQSVYVRSTGGGGAEI